MQCTWDAMKSMPSIPICWNWNCEWTKTFGSESYIHSVLSLAMDQTCSQLCRQHQKWDSWRVFHIPTLMDDGSITESWSVWEICLQLNHRSIGCIQKDEIEFQMAKNWWKQQMEQWWRTQKTQHEMQKQHIQLILIFFVMFDTFCKNKKQK